MLMARQPIFHLNGDVYGYELLYREEGKNAYTGDDGNAATLSVMAASFLSYDVSEIVENKMVFINFTEDIIQKDIATLFPIESLVVEIMDMNNPNSDLLDACKRLKSYGYMIALSDHFLEPGFEEMVSIADIIKVDFLNNSDDKKAEYIQNAQSKAQFLAEKVETQEEFQKGIQLGYTLFQGYFFAKPMIVTKHHLAPNKLNAMRLLAVLTEEDMEFEELTSIIEADVAFSYEILKIVNSAYFSRGKRISSIRQALVRLGIDEIKKWAMMTSLRKLAGEHQKEIINISMIRAKFLEMFSKKINCSQDSALFMTVGILSMLDVLTNTEMEEILSRLSLSDDVKQALLRSGKDTTLMHSYNIILNCEQGKWEVVTELAEKLKVTIKIIADTHYEAIKWMLDVNKKVNLL